MSYLVRVVGEDAADGADRVEVLVARGLVADAVQEVQRLAVAGVTVGAGEVCDERDGEIILNEGYTRVEPNVCVSK